MKMRCLIVDEEPFAVNLLSEYIGQVSWLALFHKCHTAAEARDYLRKERVDLVFIDVNLPGLKEMKLDTILPPGQLFIFTTAFAEFGVESYALNAVDYLLKPISYDRFLKAINKAAQLLAPQQKQSKKQEGNEMLLRSGKEPLKVQYEDIWLIEGLKDSVVFHTSTGKHTVYRKMKELEETLPAQFSRVHNSYIINRNHIQKIEDNHAWLNEQRVPVSEKYREPFFQKVTHLLT